MKPNLSTIDRIIRIVVALTIVTLYLTSVISGTVALILLAVAAIFALTGFMSFCPIYWSLGISSRKKIQ